MVKKNSPCKRDNEYIISLLWWVRVPLLLCLRSELPRPVFPAGPQPRAATPCVPCQAFSHTGKPINQQAIRRDALRVFQSPTAPVPPNSSLSPKKYYMGVVEGYAFILNPESGSLPAPPPHVIHHSSKPLITTQQPTPTPVFFFFVLPLEARPRPLLGWAPRGRLLPRISWQEHNIFDFAVLLLCFACATLSQYSASLATWSYWRQQYMVNHLVLSNSFNIKSPQWRNIRLRLFWPRRPCRLSGSDVIVFDNVSCFDEHSYVNVEGCAGLRSRTSRTFVIELQQNAASETCGWS